MHTHPSAPVTGQTDIPELATAMRRDTAAEAKANVPQMAVALEPTLPNLLEFRVALIDQGRALIELLKSVEMEINKGGERMQPGRVRHG